MKRGMQPLDVPRLDSSPSNACRDDSDIGSEKDWPDALRSLAPCIFTLSYPAAIFWGDKLAMIYNEAWETTSHSALKQGKPPNGVFKKDTLDALRDYFHDRIPRPVVASEFPGHHAASTEKASVVCSPIHDDAKVAGVLVQIFSKTHHDETALDRQPFFQKFAEMLPTGLAILNHKADPLFVNHQFHNLTAHRGPDQSFRMWPETIHPDDYERVMDEYHKAFESQTVLETEFRAFGEDQWRLFLMRPLGKNNLQQFDLRQLGGYICALIDVSDMKNAEIAQTRVAKEARERKQQQERFIDMYEPRWIERCDYKHANTV
jgi:PAS domain-containing protein